MANQLIEATVERLLERIEKAQGNWVREWVEHGGGVPSNYTTGKAYRGINIIMLWSAREQLGYRSSQWAGYKQWLAKGYQVRAGERSTIVFVNQPVTKLDKATGEEKNYRLFKCSFVFNADQLVTPPPRVEIPENEHERIEACEATIAALDLKLEIGDPAYFPKLDLVRMPVINVFDKAESYYSTLFHEVTHWTMKKDRCDRSLPYANEELVAEWGAAFLCARHGISEPTERNSSEYIKHWLGQVEGDKGDALIKAASKASEAVEFIMARQFMKPAMEELMQA